MKKKRTEKRKKKDFYLPQHPRCARSSCNSNIVLIFEVQVSTKIRYVTLTLQKTCQTEIFGFLWSGIFWLAWFSTFWCPMLKSLCTQQFKIQWKPIFVPNSMLLLELFSFPKTKINSEICLNCPLFIVVYIRNNWEVLDQ